MSDSVNCQPSSVNCQPSSVNVLSDLQPRLNSHASKSLELDQKLMKLTEDFEARITALEESESPQSMLKKQVEDMKAIIAKLYLDNGTLRDDITTRTQATIRFRATNQSYDYQILERQVRALADANDKLTSDNKVLRDRNECLFQTTRDNLEYMKEKAKKDLAESREKCKILEIDRDTLKLENSSIKTTNNWLYAELNDHRRELYALSIRIGEMPDGKIDCNDGTS
jgi:chromosome segregation ATPase